MRSFECNSVYFRTALKMLGALIFQRAQPGVAMPLAASANLARMAMTQQHPAQSQALPESAQLKWARPKPRVFQHTQATKEKDTQAQTADNYAFSTSLATQ